MLMFETKVRLHTGFPKLYQSTCYLFIDSMTFFIHFQGDSTRSPMIKAKLPSSKETEHEGASPAVFAFKNLLFQLLILFILGVNRLPRNSFNQQRNNLSRYIFPSHLNLVHKVNDYTVHKQPRLSSGPQPFIRNKVNLSPLYSEKVASRDLGKGEKTLALLNDLMPIEEKESLGEYRGTVRLSDGPNTRDCIAPLTGGRSSRPYF